MKKYYFTMTGTNHYYGTEFLESWQSEGVRRMTSYLYNVKPKTDELVVDEMCMST